MRAVAILPWLPLVYTQGHGMVESIPNMENHIGEQIPMAFDASVPEGKAAMRVASDATGLFGNRDWTKNNPALGNSEYNRICPRLNGKVADLGNGLSVQYHCDTYPGSWDNYNWTSGLRSVEECARLCSSRPNCKSSFWYKDAATCWVSESSTTSGRTTNGYVHMIPLSGPQPEECADAKKQWQIEKAGYEARISDCNKRVDGLERQLKESDRGCFQCPDYDKETFHDRGADYTIYCSKADDACDDRANIHVLTTSTPKQCIQACTKTPKCDRAIWPTALGSNQKGPCWLRPYTDLAGPVPLGTGCAGYSSAHIDRTVVAGAQSSV